MWIMEHTLIVVLHAVLMRQTDCIEHTTNYYRITLNTINPAPRISSPAPQHTSQVLHHNTHHKPRTTTHITSPAPQHISQLLHTTPSHVDFAAAYADSSGMEVVIYIRYVSASFYPGVSWVTEHGTVGQGRSRLSRHLLTKLIINQL